MASGNILSLGAPTLLPDLLARITSLSMEQYSIKHYSVDVGYVYSHSAFLSVWLYNGTYSDVIITDIIEVQEAGIVVSGAGKNDVIPARSAIKVVFEVTKYGALNFTSTFQFISLGSLYSPIVTISGTRRLISTDQPRPIDMTSAMEEAYAYADPQDTFYDTLEFNSAIENDKILVVNSDEKLQTPQGEFIPCYFDCTLPETQGSVRGQMQITVSFLPRDAQAWIRKATQDRAIITVIWRQYLGPNQEPDAWYPIPLQISTVEQTPTGVTATALFPDLVNIPFPRRIMTTTELPGGII
jgi:hypothetical protein